MTHATTICPVCEEGRLTPATHELSVKHGDRTLHVPGLEHAVCDVCGEEPVLADQIRRNQRRITDAKRDADGLLVGEEIRALRQRLGLTQQAAAVAFGGGANAFSKYERGDVIQSVAMDRLLRLARLCPFLLPVLQQMAGMDVVSAAAPSSYGNDARVRINDDHYRSRTVAGSEVLVNVVDWRQAA